jgi:serine protease Do
MAGINPGSVILEVNRKPVSNAEEFKQAVAQTSEKGAVLLLIKEGQYSRYVVLKTE